MSGARQGRRRRILQDEVLSASRELAAHPGDQAPSGQAERRRYALSTGSLGSALAQGHFPNRIVVPLAALAGTVATVGGLAALDLYRQAVAGLLGEHTLVLADATSPTSLAAWATMGAAMLVAVLAAMILAVRSRRVDDYKGRHRLWRGATLAAMLLSLDAATELHSHLAETLAQTTGVRLLAGGAEWWLVLGGATLAWVAGRVALDIKESKLAICVFAAATLAGGVAVVGPLAGIGGASTAMIAKLAQLTAYLLSAASLVAFMRYLRHDVAAGVANKPQRTRTSNVKLAAATTLESKSDRKEVTDEPRQTGRASKKKDRLQETPAAASQSTQWTDGSDGYNDNYDDEPQTRKLSKSERKRLRQQKAGRRAA